MLEVASSLLSAGITHLIPTFGVYLSDTHRPLADLRIDVGVHGTFRQHSHLLY